jgi:hypothetical protein
MKDWVELCKCSGRVGDGESGGGKLIVGLSKLFMVADA